MISISISDKKIPSADIALELLRTYAEENNLGDVSNARYSHTPDGAPFFEGITQEVYVSVSHSENRVACAISDRKVGIDIEYIRPREYANIAYRYGIFPKNLKDFYRIWTLAEATIKATSVSLSEALKNPSENARTLDIYDDDYAVAICTA